MRGRSEVAWSIEIEKGKENWRTGGNFMALLRKQPDGNWLISHLIWDDLALLADALVRQLLDGRHIASLARFKTLARNVVRKLDS